jgi:hypothetical protein
MALKQFGMTVGEGLCTDMRAVRKDYFLDHDHSAYVDQWDWEKAITAEQRNLDTLKDTVRKIWKVIKGADVHLQRLFTKLKSEKYPDLPDEITFLHAEEILDMYPDLPRKQRETMVIQKYPAIFIIGIGLGLVLFLYFFTHYTRIGLAFRGIAQNERTAISLGIKSDWTAALSLAFGSAMASVAAIVILPLGIISINTGYEVLLIAVAVGIVGGLESVPGILVASLILGYAQIITGTYFKPEWMMVVYLAAIVFILAIKPSGLFGKFKELEERV